MKSNNPLIEYQELYRRVHGKRMTVAEQMHFEAEFERNLDELKQYLNELSYEEAAELKRNFDRFKELQRNAQ